ASMGCSLEARVPLLNSLLVEHATRLPIDLKLRGMTRKYLLRKALAGRLPRQIIDRPKKGFGIPVSRWLHTELRELMEDLLSEDRLRRQGLFNPAYVRGLIDDHLAKKQDNRKPLWSLLVFQLWHQRYLENATVSPTVGPFEDSAQKSARGLAAVGGVTAP
ncbi:MAG: asparagine synthase-related protein, partial [Candidatus Dormibacteraceae bacterium]